MTQTPPDSSGTAPAFPFASQEALEFMQKMWNPLGVPIPGFGVAGAGAGTPPGAIPFPSPAAMYAALDPAEIERRISELKVIEGWLSMTLHLMQTSIKTMELQKASFEALRAAHAPVAAAMGGGDAPRK